MNIRQLNNASARIGQAINSLQVVMTELHSKSRAGDTLTPVELELLEIFDKLHENSADLEMAIYTVEEE